MSSAEDVMKPGATLTAARLRAPRAAARRHPLPTPTEREQSQTYNQRYTPHWPAAGVAGEQS